MDHVWQREGYAVWQSPQRHQKGLVSSPTLHVSSSGHENVVNAVDVIRYASGVFYLTI